MNQDILFNEGAQWHATEQRVEFTAQQLGALIRCFISHGQLEQLAGEPLLSEQAILSAFERLRFDLDVITSYSIHYTKLYDISELRRNLGAR